MKAGLTIEELATEVMRQKDAKADYIVNTSMLAMEHCGIIHFFALNQCGYLQREWRFQMWNGSYSAGTVN